MSRERHLPRTSSEDKNIGDNGNSGCESEHKPSRAATPQTENQET